jgi:hypothetical protein
MALAAGFDGGPLKKNLVLLRGVKDPLSERLPDFGASTVGIRDNQQSDFYF